MIGGRRVRTRRVGTADNRSTVECVTGGFGPDRTFSHHAADLSHRNWTRVFTELGLVAIDASAADRTIGVPLAPLRAR